MKGVQSWGSQMTYAEVAGCSMSSYTQTGKEQASGSPSSDNNHAHCKQEPAYLLGEGALDNKMRTPLARPFSSLKAFLIILISHFYKTELSKCRLDVCTLHVGIGRILPGFSFYFILFQRLITSSSSRPYPLFPSVLVPDVLSADVCAALCLSRRSRRRFGRWPSMVSMCCSREKRRGGLNLRLPLLAGPPNERPSCPAWLWPCRLWVLLVRAPRPTRL